MRNIQDTIKKLSAAHIKEIKNILRIKDPARNLTSQIYTKLLSYPGMSEMILHLNSDERKILHLAHEDKNGITYDQIGRSLQLENDKIEKYTNNLTNKLLIYVLKNRQKLSNKLDKVHLLPEIYNILNPLDDHLINKNFSDISTSQNKKEIKINKNPAVKYLDDIFNSGGIVLLDEFESIVPAKSLQKILTDLLKYKYIYIYHDLSFSGKTMIVLDKKIFLYLAEKKENKKSNPIDVQNRYNFLINLLKVYDTVSTYGLFLTKQNHFRKIDKKHLQESMIKIYGMNGNALSSSLVSKISLYLLYIQGCVKITNSSSVIISLKKIANLINDPYVWLNTLMKLIDDPLKYDSLFKPPLDIPETKTVHPVIRLIKDNNNNTGRYVEAAFFTQLYSKIKNSDFLKFKEYRQNHLKSFQLTMNYLCITGIIDIDNDIISLSDIGKKITDKEKQKDQKSAEAPEKKIQKSIYLNPDFTLIIPKKEISSAGLYHILTHTEIIKDDIILHTRISRESTLMALKREMNNNNFYSTLKKYLKTEIPDNLNFLISEWLNQTIRMNIFDACIIKTNNSFLDKISHSKIKNCIEKRLTDEYAIINRKYLDKLIKMAKENDVIINLFDENKDLS